MRDRNGFFNKPWVRITAVLSGCALVYLILGRWVDPRIRLLSWMIVIPIFCLGVIFWLSFFSQFLLPVRNIDGRVEVLKRLFSYLLGFHGPTIFIENGNVMRSNQEEIQKSPGVIWLDPASAAVLRTATAYVGAKGPGLVFTKQGEYLAGTIDLHTYRQTIGPRNDDQPFSMPPEHPDYQAVQNRLWETRGLTRDGIEVIPTFTLMFKVDAEENEGGTPFGYNQDSVFKAVRDSLVAGSTTNFPVWNPIIAKMVVDVWREYLHKFKLDELFEAPPGGNQTTLQLILTHIKDHLVKGETDELNEFGQSTGSKKPCTEYQQIKQMGWKVINISIKKIIFSGTVEERLVNQWTTSWLKNAHMEQDQVERSRSLHEIRGQDEALKEYALYASQELAEVQPQSKTHALELLIHSLFTGAIRNTALDRRMNTERRDLTSIFRWLRDKRGIRNDNS